MTIFIIFSSKNTRGRVAENLARLHATLVRHRQLKFLGHILRMSKEEPARRYALYIPTIGKRRPGRPRTSYLNYVQRLLGDNEGAMQEQQIAAFADDHRAWRNLVVACSQPMDDDDTLPTLRDCRVAHGMARCILLRTFIYALLVYLGAVAQRK